MLHTYVTYVPVLPGGGERKREREGGGERGRRENVCNEECDR